MPKRTAVKHKSAVKTPAVVKTEPAAKPTKKRARLGGLKMWIWLAVAVLVLFEAMINNNQATNGQQLSELQDQQVRLSSDVNDLQRQIAATGSLQSIRQRATERLGLQEVNKNVLYIAWPTASPTPTETLSEDTP